MGEEKRLVYRIEDVNPGKLKGQLIAMAKGSSGSLQFDVIEGLMSVNKGDIIEVTLTTEKPENLDPYDFCGHGYLVRRVDDHEIFSIWGILFVFSPPVGLRDNVKYYLCVSIKK